MEYWWSMLSCDCIIPIIMILYGRMMWKHYPKKINNYTGYRTKRSMKNADTWKFANEACGKLWWILGWIVLIPSFLFHLYYGTNETTLTILMIIQCVIMIGSIIPAEIALRKTFHYNGSRKE